MNKRIFISRSIPSEKVHFYHKTAHIDLIGSSLIDFTPIEDAIAPDADILFFYSAKAVQFFFDLFGSATFLSYQVACLGPGAEQILHKHHIHIAFCGNGDPEQTKNLFNEYATGKSVLFAIPSQSTKSFDDGNQNYKTLYTTIYSNQPKAKFEIPQADVYLFTSSLNVKAFLLNGGDKTKPCVAIGQSTLHTLKKNHFSDIHISVTSTENSIIEKGISLITHLKS